MNAVALVGTRHPPGRLPSRAQRLSCVATFVISADVGWLSSSLVTSRMQRSSRRPRRVVRHAASLLVRSNSTAEARSRYERTDAARDRVPRDRPRRRSRHGEVVDVRNDPGRATNSSTTAVRAFDHTAPDNEGVDLVAGAFVGIGADNEVVGRGDPRQVCRRPGKIQSGQRKR